MRPLVRTASAIAIALAGAWTAGGAGAAAPPAGPADPPPLPGLVNVRDHGARGDGVTDDTAAFRAAIDACPPGGAVWVPPSAASYRLTGTLHVRTPGVRILGAGPGTGSHPSPAAPGSHLCWTSPVGPEGGIRFGPRSPYAGPLVGNGLEGLRLSMVPGSGNTLVNLVATHDLEIRGCMLVSESEANSNIGIFLQNDPGFAGTGNGNWSGVVRIHGVSAYWFRTALEAQPDSGRASNGVAANGPHSVTYVTVRDSYFYGTNGHSLPDLGVVNLGDGASVSGCGFESLSYGIVTSRPGGIFGGNRFEAIRGADIWLRAGAGGSWIDGNAHSFGNSQGNVRFDSDVERRWSHVVALNPSRPGHGVVNLVGQEDKARPDDLAGLAAALGDLGVIVPDGLTGPRTLSLPAAARVALDAPGVDEFAILVSDGRAFRIDPPSRAARGRRITVRLENRGAGPAGAVTWGATFRMAPWSSPAPGFSRSIDFRFDGTRWVEVSRTPADVPN